MRTASISPPAARTGVNIATGKSQSDFTVFINGLLPLIDFLSLPSAAFIATNVHQSWFTTANIAGHQFDERYVMAAMALLAPILLYDKRFISVAARGHVGALIRCYLTGFALFIGSVMILGRASGIVDAISGDVFLIWFLLTFIFTALTRVMLAASVMRSVEDGVLVDAIAIVGSGIQAERLARYLKQTKPFTPELLGIFDDNPLARLGVVASDGHIDTAAATPVSGSIEDLIDLGKSRRIDWILLTTPYTDEDTVDVIVNRLKALSVPIALGPSNLEPNAPFKMIDYIGDGIPVTLLQTPADTWRATVRSVGQFLPRWVTTLFFLSGLFAHNLWSRVQARAKLEEAKNLVCVLDDYDLDGFFKLAHDFGQEAFGYVVTPNVDHLIRLHDNAEFRELYASAQYVVMDSRFLSRLLRIRGDARLPVCTGSDLTVRLLESLRGSMDRVVLIGGREDQITQLASRYELNNLAHYNPPMGFIQDAQAVEECLKFIEAHAPFRYCLLAVGSPQQEMLARALQSRGNARGLALCVGASLDFLTGVERRAPGWMQRSGFEWFYRLLQNPARQWNRYLVRGPRIFSLLRRTKFVLRSHAKSDATVIKAEAA